MTKQHAFATFFFLSVMGAAACSASPDDLGEAAASSDDALATASGDAPAPATKTPEETPDSVTPSPGGNWLDFVGAWESAGTAPVHALVFLNTPQGIGHSYFARRGASLSSASAKPAPSPEGTYTVSKDFVNFVQKDGSPDLSGSYRYQFEGKGGDTLVLSGGTMKVPATYKRVSSYCDAPVDCAGQGILTVDCTGNWSCSAKHTCSWLCGPPVVDGEACGKNICGKGTRCCNPLTGICTPAGIACTL